MRVIFIARLLGAIPGSTKCEDNNFAQSKSLLKFCEGGVAPIRADSGVPPPSRAAQRPMSGMGQQRTHAVQQKKLFDHPIGTEKQAAGGSYSANSSRTRAAGPGTLRTECLVKALVPRKYDRGVCSSATTYSRDASSHDKQ